MPIVHTSFVLAVPDADATARFFIEKLGFQTQFVIPGQWHFVERDRCRVMLGSCPDQLRPSELGDHSYFGYLNVTGIDALYAEFKENGLEVPEPTDKPWGMREFAIRTPDGHRLTLGQEL